MEEEKIGLYRYKSIEEVPEIGFSGHSSMWYRSHMCEKIDT